MPLVGATSSSRRCGRVVYSGLRIFSSTSKSWCEHAQRFVEGAIDRLALGEDSNVVELAPNDGYLLQYLKQRGIPCIGIEPRATAEAARANIETIEASCVALAQELEPADLVVANNVLAHVPDINDFVAGIALLLKPEGRASIEFTPTAFGWQSV